MVFWLELKVCFLCNFEKSWSVAARYLFIANCCWYSSYLETFGLFNLEVKNLLFAITSGVINGPKPRWGSISDVGLGSRPPLWSVISFRYWTFALNMISKVDYELWVGLTLPALVGVWGEYGLTFLVSLSVGDMGGSLLSLRIIIFRICSLYVGVCNWFRAAESEVPTDGEFLEDEKWLFNPPNPDLIITCFGGILLGAGITFLAKANGAAFSFKGP